MDQSMPPDGNGVSPEKLARQVRQLRHFGASRNRASPRSVECCMDDERRAIRAEGLDPDDLAVRAALDLARRELELLAR
jgi:hypothetical protein